MSQPSRLPGRRFLHSPGPTPLPDAVLHAMSVQPMDLGDPRVDANISAVEQGLRRLLHSARADVFLYACNGHGVWEAVVENLAAPDESVLIAGTGHFSESWAVQTEALGRRVVRTPWREGWPIDAGAIEQALRDDADHEIRALFVVHTDTASGVTSDIAAMRRALDAARHPALLVADVVASLGAAPFAMDELGVDVAVGASQKGLMCPPGVGFVAVNAKAFAAAESNPAPRFYWDWVRRKHEMSYRKFCGTPPQNVLFGMEAALGLIFREGLDAVWSRHARLAGAVHAAIEGWREGGVVDFFAQVPASVSHRPPRRLQSRDDPRRHRRCRGGDAHAGHAGRRGRAARRASPRRRVARQLLAGDETLCLINRPFSRSQSRFFSVSRLSCWALPLANAISALTRPPL
jgi:alanine-glyoxylate transaminase/serine-glyoxylate transaminase/serine-pyruvate transaminase